MAEKKGKYDPITGITRCVVVAINPTLEEANALRGTTWDKPVEYVGKDKQNNDRVLVEIWLKDTTSGTLFQQKYYISNALRTSKNNPKNKQWGSAIGQVGWSENIAELEAKSWWNEQFPSHELLVGEEGLVEFLAAWVTQGSRPSDKFPMTDVNLAVDMKKLFTGDFSELKAMVTKYISPVIILATVSEFGGKKRQSIWKSILPGNDYFFDKVKNKDTAGIVGGWFSGIEDEKFGCRDEYSLELLHGGTATAYSSTPSFTAPAGNKKTEVQGSGGSDLPF